MSDNQYRTIIDKICQLSLIESPDRFYKTANFTVAGVDFTLLPQLEEHAEAILIYADMGDVPKAKRSAALLALLKMNFHLSSVVYRPAFCWNDISGHVLLTGSVDLRSTTAEGVLLIMKAFAELSSEWHAHAFVGDTNAAKPRSAAEAETLSNAAIDRALRRGVK